MLSIRFKCDLEASFLSELGRWGLRVKPGEESGDFCQGGVRKGSMRSWLGLVCQPRGLSCEAHHLLVANGFAPADALTAAEASQIGIRVQRQY
jgi:hypothetical protein